MRRGAKAGLENNTTKAQEALCVDGAPFMPGEVGDLENPQTAPPRIAKDAKLVGLIERS
jgi:hypothetical protein